MIQIPELLLTLAAVPFLVYSANCLLGFALIFGGLVLVWSGYRETQSRSNCFNPELTCECKNCVSLKKAVLEELKSPPFYINSLLLSAPLIILFEKNSTFFIASVLFLVVKSFIEAFIHTFALFIELKNERRRRFGMPRRNVRFARIYDAIKKLILGEIIEDAEVIRPSREDRHFKDNSDSHDRPSSSQRDSDNYQNNSESDRSDADHEYFNGQKDSQSRESSESKDGQGSRLENFEGAQKNNGTDHERSKMREAGYRTFLHQFFSVVLFVAGLIITLAGIIRLFPNPS